MNPTNSIGHYAKYVFCQSFYLVFFWGLVGSNLTLILFCFFCSLRVSPDVHFYSETPICGCHPLMNPSTLRHTAVDVNPPGFRGCSTLVAARLKNGEELLQVTSIFCDEEKKTPKLSHEWDVITSRMKGNLCSGLSVSIHSQVIPRGI